MTEHSTVRIVRYYIDRASEHPALHRPTLELILDRLQAFQRGDQLHELRGLIGAEGVQMPPVGSRYKPYQHYGEWRVPVSRRGHYAVIDEEDVEFIGQWDWSRWFSQEPFKEYAFCKAKKGEPKPLMHRVIASRFLDIAGFLVDHKNGNGLDNRRANLRPATFAQNAQNKKRPRNNKSGAKGVSPDRGRWRAQIRDAEGKSRYLGTFDTVKEAAAVYKKASEEMHGEFRRDCR